MLRELKSVRQVRGEPRRRWFTSSDCDLIVWYEGSETLGFQICYDKGRAEKALTWKSPGHFTHMAVDDGEQRPARYKATPILVADGHFDAHRVTGLFRRESGDVPADLVEFVVAKLGDYPGTPG
jgi:hypothetical protein